MQGRLLHRIALRIREGQRVGASHRVAYGPATIDVGIEVDALEGRAQPRAREGIARAQVESLCPRRPRVTCLRWRPGSAVAPLLPGRHARVTAPLPVPHLAGRHAGRGQSCAAPLDRGGRRASRCARDLARPADPQPRLRGLRRDRAARQRRLEGPLLLPARQPIGRPGLPESPRRRAGDDLPPP